MQHWGGEAEAAKEVRLQRSLLHDDPDAATPPGHDDDEPYRILVVDDEPAVRSFLIALFDGEPGFEVAGEAETGEEAAEAAPVLRPDVILMDVRMPGIGGIEATRRIRQSDPTISVLIHTAYDEASAIESSKQAGAFAYAVKGCDVGFLVHLVRTAGAYARAGGAPRSFRTA